MKEKERMKEKSGKKREKRPYEKPAFGSGELFETNVLACAKQVVMNGCSLISAS